MSNFYEKTLLREEFRLVVKLQKSKEFSKYVDIKYYDRTTGELKSVSMAPNGNRYPEEYLVDFRMPVYDERKQIRRDWHGEAKIRLNERVLSNRNADESPHVKFTSNFKPFNNHVLKDAICSGNAWAVAKDNGLWHFIISLGALINQDEFVSADGEHFNSQAYRHWRNRGRKPVTKINWPLDLLSKADINIERHTPNHQQPENNNRVGKIRVVRNGHANDTKKKTIKVVSKNTGSGSPKKINIVKN